MANFFNKIIKICIYLLVFLVPLWFLPFSYETYEFNKQFLLALLVSVAFFCWIAKMVLVDKELKFKRTPLDIFVGVFLFVAILSAVFSVDRGSSLFGFYGRFSDGLIGPINLVVLYFLITNNIGIKNGILKTFLLSVGIVALTSYLSISGVLARFNFERSFNPAGGSMEALAIFLAVIIVWLAGMILFKPKDKLSSFVYYLLLIASLFLLLVIDFAPAWIVLLITLGLFLGFALWQKMFREKDSRLTLPIILIIIAGVFLMINLPGIFPAQFRGLPKEPILDQGTSWQISLKALTDDVKSGFLGSGMGTFFYDFAKQKPAEFNQSPFWQMRFDRANNHISEIIATLGFLGIISYLILIGFFLMISYFLIEALSKKSNETNLTNKTHLPLLMAFLALLVAQFVYYQNTALAFTFWLILALSVVSWPKPAGRAISEKIFSLKESPELGRLLTIFLIIIGLAMAGSYYFAQKIYQADILYAKSQKMALGPGRTTLIEKAVSLNPNFAQYQAILARAYLEEALKEMRKPTEAKDPLLLQQKVAKAIDTAKKATEKGPGQIATWETLAMVYRDIGLFATGATEWGIKSFEKAITLEPTNPVLHTELGKLLAINNPAKAKTAFAKAIELKPDYLPALIQEALIFEKEENLEKAVEKMLKLSLEYPFNSEILFQLGRLYFNQKRIDDAILQLEKVLSFQPNHSNALYSLGIAYKEKSQKEKAISAFEKVLELNPGNQDIIAKLEELKK